MNASTYIISIYKIKHTFKLIVLLLKFSESKVKQLRLNR